MVLMIESSRPFAAAVVTAPILKLYLQYLLWSILAFFKASRAVSTKRVRDNTLPSANRNSGLVPFLGAFWCNFRTVWRCATMLGIMSILSLAITAMYSVKHLVQLTTSRTRRWDCCCCWMAWNWLNASTRLSCREGVGLASTSPLCLLPMGGLLGGRGWRRRHLLRLLLTRSLRALSNRLWKRPAIVFSWASEKPVLPLLKDSPGSGVAITVAQDDFQEHSKNCTRQGVIAMAQGVGWAAHACLAAPPPSNTHSHALHVNLL